MDEAAILHKMIEEDAAEALMEGATPTVVSVGTDEVTTVQKVVDFRVADLPLVATLSPFPRHKQNGIRLVEVMQVMLLLQRNLPLHHSRTFQSYHHRNKKLQNLQHRHLL